MSGGDAVEVEALCAWEFAHGIRCTLRNGHEGKHVIAVDQKLNELSPVVTALKKLSPTAQLGALVGGILGGALGMAAESRPCMAHNLHNCAMCKSRVGK